MKTKLENLAYFTTDQTNLPDRVKEAIRTLINDYECRYKGNTVGTYCENILIYLTMILNKYRIEHEVNEDSVIITDVEFMTQCALDKYNKNRIKLLENNIERLGNESSIEIQFDNISFRAIGNGDIETIECFMGNFTDQYGNEYRLF